MPASCAILAISGMFINSFPLDIDTYGYINPIIKQLVKLPFDENKLGDLVRKGVYRGSGKGDHSLLESLTELLSETNSSSENLCEHIISDLKLLYKHNQSIIIRNISSKN